MCLEDWPLAKGSQILFVLSACGASSGRVLFWVRSAHLVSVGMTSLPCFLVVGLYRVFVDGIF